MSTDTPPSRPASVHVATIIAGVLLLLGLIAAVVILSRAGKTDAEITALMVPVGTVGGVLLAALDKLSKIRDETKAQTETLNVIDHRTNGVLDRRIRTQVHKVLDERGFPRMDTKSYGSEKHSTPDGGKDTIDGSNGSVAA